MESPVFSILILAAFGMMVLVSGGVMYLTFAEWRDRRRQNQDERSTKPKRRR